ncbi:MAG: class I tRNA ligase family protein, partial [Candidatus Paceibacterota bacterium]
NGKRALWIPGTDSAALATQSKVESNIYKEEKKRRDEIGREELLKRIAEFAEESKNTIIGQTKKMGSSLDWSRYAYTLDEPRYNAVMEAFIRMYKDGLIYRGGRSVNWDPNMQTTVSDDEIEYVEQKDPFYYFKYGPFTIGTVRPETKFGDKYVVMHPDDARYKEYQHGQQFELEWINGPITATVIKDEAADPEMGSGVMTITPWHSAVDFEIAERHGLDMEQIIDERGILLPVAGEFAGQHIKKARAAIIAKMQDKGLIEKVDENYVHNVATNERGGGMIEPQIKEQWFVAVNKEFTMGKSEIPGVNEGDIVTLKTLMQKSVEAGGIDIFPERFKRVYYNWINNLHDWCISRQIWYGHRIPVWYKDGEMKVQKNLPAPAGNKTGHA